MHDHEVSPYASITIDGKDYELSCTVDTLRKLQKEFGKDVITLQSDCFHMIFDDLAKLFFIGIDGGDYTVKAIGDKIVEEIGILEAQRIAATWLVIAITPLHMRKKKAEALREALKEVSLG